VGVGLDVLATEALARHARGYPSPQLRPSRLPAGGRYAWRRDGERHMWNPDTIGLLQHAVRYDSAASYAEFATTANEDATRRAALRGLLDFRPIGDPIPLGAGRRVAGDRQALSTGAMSLGSLSREVHETLAVAMNELGGRSNTGEGGEDPERFP